MRDPQTSNRAFLTLAASLGIILSMGNVLPRSAGGQAPTPYSPSAVQNTNAATPRPVHLNLKRFQIPFNIDSVGARPVEVQLHVSRDQGRQWELFAAQPITAKHFLFATPVDGLFWFATRTVDDSGQSYPPGPIRPQLIVNVDTTEPRVELQATLSSAGNVLVTLACDDASPAIDSIRIDFTVDQSQQWTPVNDIAGKTDPAEPFRVQASGDFQPPDGWHHLSLRALVGDLAGNKTIVTHQIERPRIAAGQLRLAGSKTLTAGEHLPTERSGSPMDQSQAPRIAQLPGAFAPSPPPAGVLQSLPASQAPTPMTSPAASLNRPGGEPASVAHSQPSPADVRSAWAVPHFAISSGMVPVAPPRSTDSVSPELVAPLPPGEPPYSNELPLTDGAVSVPSIARPAQEPPRPKTAAAAMRPLESGGSASSAAVLAPNGASSQSMQRVSNDSGTPTAPPGVAGEASLLPRDVVKSRVEGEQQPVGSLADAGIPMRYSSSRKFSLEYEIESAGLSGVADVELWGTTDRGVTWKRWGSDPDRESPFDIETNNDGAYGFRIVVVANNGLATPRPLENDTPDMFVIVDTVSPMLRITAAAYGEGNQTGSLVIRYECDDLHLTPRPISLAFGSTPTGPWSTIAAGLENQGAYVWPADPHLPRQIYLRVDAIDLAGNLAHYILETPINIQGLAPRARIRGFNPLTGSPGGNGQNRADSPSSPSGERPQTATQPQPRFK